MSGLISDWEQMKKKMPACVPHNYLEQFCTALRLHPAVESVVEHNTVKLKGSGSPIAVIKAMHTGPNVSKCSANDASGLKPLVCLADRHV